MAVALNDLGGLAAFDCGDTQNIGTRWKRWLRAFEFFADGKGITDAKQKRALLLHQAGLSVQDVFHTLEIPVPGEDSDVYKETVGKLDDYFTPQVNVPFERHVFRSMEQRSNESIEQYVTRLREKATTCEFTSVDEQIRDQVIEKCASHKLRLKMLEKGKTLTLKQVCDMARAMEQAESQASAMESVRKEVNKLSFTAGKKRDPTSRTSSGFKCYSCGRDGHKSSDTNCPAKGKQCRFCRGNGHFEKCCRKKHNTGNESEKRKDKSRKVRQVEEYENSNCTDNDDHAFMINTIGRNDSSKMDVKIGGIDVPVVIDSGASCNVTDRRQWEQLKNSGIKCVSEKSSKTLFAYGQKDPLPIAGIFWASVKQGGKQLNNVEFIVIEGEGQTLIGQETATKLGVLHIGPQRVNVVDEKVKDKWTHQYPECFQGFGKLMNYQLHVPMNKDIKPVAQPIKRVPFNLREPLEKKIDELETLDIIEKVTGPSEWVPPVVVVPKANNDLRLCVDMRRANEAVLRERYPIPTVDEVLHDMNNSSVFSKLDIKWAYHQIELDNQSREITTFVTHKGLYRYKRLMFGISCAPEMYQKVMTSVLQDCDGVKNIMDDIVVHGSNEGEHDMRLSKVLSKLKESGLTLNPLKCSFNMTKIIFMGHVLSANGIGPTESRVKDVLNACRPESASEVKSFLGLVNFSARFIPSLATLNEPLRKLTKKGESFNWGPEQDQAFKRLKECLAEAKVLGYFDKNEKTQVMTDARPVGLGAVLVQNDRVICYASRALSDVEKRYSQTEKEALGIVWACERFHAYLYWGEFELLTDHKPLECIYSKRSKPCARIERWVLRLQPYNYKVKYIPGYQNIADPLSRLVSKMSNANPLKQSSASEKYVHFVAEEATPVAMTTREIERASEIDPELQEVRENLLNGQWHKSGNKGYLLVKNEISAIGKLVLRGTRIVIPESLRDRVLELAHEGHPGIVGMKQRVRTKVWWPGIDKAVEQFCKSCYGCQLVAQPSRPEPMTRTELPSRPWQHLALDLLGPLPSGESIVVLVDYYSRWYEIGITKSTTADKITNILDKIFVTHGLPLCIQTDNGPQFISEHFKKYMKNLGISHRFTTPLWPQANGEVERQNRSIMKRIRIAVNQGQNWRSELNKYLVTYRSTAHSVTGASPAKLLFGREIRTKLPDILEMQENDLDSEVRDRDAERKEKGRLYADKRRNAQESELKEGDKVLIRQEKSDKFSAPFKTKPLTVMPKKGNSVVVSDQDVTYKRNVTHVKKFLDRSSRSDKNFDPESNQYNDIGGSVDSNSCLGSNLDSSPCQDGLFDSGQHDDGNNGHDNQSQSEQSPVYSRPVRTRKLPEKFNDFVMSKK